MHEFTSADWSEFPQDPQTADAVYHDPETTLNEATTRYDARMRPVARTVWLIELGYVAKNDPPIAGTHGTDATDGLTTTWVYDEDLTDSDGLDATYAAYLTDLSLGEGSVGSAVEETNPEGEKTARIFDGLGRLVKTIDGNGNARKIVYDAMASGTPGAQGSVLQTTFYDGLNHTTKTRVDGLGRTLSTVDAESRATAYAYDANSNRIRLRDPNGVGEDCVFDARNREILCTDTLSVDGEGNATGDAVEYAYDNHNNLIETTDAKTQATTCEYDARDRKVSCTDRNEGVTAWVYDENSNLTALTDAEESTTTFTYDPRNLKVEELYPGHSLPGNNELVAFGYDARGRMAFRLDQKEELTEYEYDRVDRLIRRTYPDTSEDLFTYDKASRLTSAECGRYDTLVERAYDDGGRMTSETLTVDATAYTTTSAYDAADRRTSITYPNGKVVAQTYTNRDQFSNIKYDGSNVGTFAYDLGMRRTTLTFGNSKVETRTYRGDNRITEIATPNVTDFTYTFDANKNPLTQGSTHNTTDDQDYDYDPEDRLIDFQRNGSGNNQAWQLSLVGDWDQFTNGGSSQTRTHNSVHELTAIDAASLSYDLKGNLTAHSNGQTYTWDFENLMASATVGEETAEYVYDAFRRRVKKTFDENSTVFVYDGWRCIAEYDNGAAASAPDRLFVFGAYLDEVLMMRNSAGTKYYYHTNHLYSVHAITNQSGAIVEAVKSYDAYGKATVITGAGTDSTWFTSDDVTGSATAIGNPFFYTGQRLDPETGLMYYKNRYMSVDLGRFISRDPIGILSVSDLYNYAANSPAKFLDLFGWLPYPADGGGLSDPTPPTTAAELAALMQFLQEVANYSQNPQRTRDDAKRILSEYRERYGDLLTIAEQLGATGDSTDDPCCDCYFKVLSIEPEHQIFQIVGGHLQIIIIKVPKGEKPNAAQGTAIGRSGSGVAPETPAGTPGGAGVKTQTDWIKFDCSRIKTFIDNLVRNKPDRGGYNVLTNSCATLGIEAGNCLLGEGNRADFRQGGPVTNEAPTGWKPPDVVTTIKDYCIKSALTTTK
ncbi:MAG: hypothetical protein M5U26_22925 [Planctomycetota bacterium]|nr:hypothetical protein [Planctomycetota bacterium]